MLINNNPKAQQYIEGNKNEKSIINIIIIILLLLLLLLTN